jgi:hypothetical protein
MSFFLNFKVDSDWKKTLGAAFSTLRQKVFMDTNDFKFSEFHPELSASGSMTVTRGVYSCQVCAIGEVVWLRYYINFTTGGVASSIITATVPFTVWNDPNVNDGQYSTCYTEDGAGAAIGFVIFPTKTNLARFLKPASANWGLGTGRYVICNTFYIRET